LVCHSAKRDQKKIHYEEFIKEYPNSANVISAYFSIGNIYNDNLKKYPDAIKEYKLITEKFPDKKEAKNSLFLIAFIYDNYLQDKENAKTAYKNFLAKYPTDTDPNDNLSGSAKVMLESLESGKSIEDMIMKNIENQPDDQKQAGDKKDEKKESMKKEEKKDPDKEPMKQMKMNAPDPNTDQGAPPKTEKK